MIAVFNLGTQELIILVIGGLFCAGVVAAVGVILYVLTRSKDEPRND